MTRLLALLSIAILLAGCGSSHSPSDADVNHDLHDFATRYTAAWSSQDPARVASFFAPRGSLTINDGEPSVGVHSTTLPPLRVGRGACSAQTESTKS